MKDILKYFVVVLIFGLTMWIEYLCWSNIGDSKDAEVNVALIVGGVTVPVLTLTLTLDFKSNS